MTTYSLNKKILQVENISKVFPGVIALNNVSMEFEKGEVHAIVGENGAGKSTLIKILSGSLLPTAGKIYFNEKYYDHFFPKQAIDLGISVIYQELSIIPYLSIAENIFLGNKLNKGFIINKKLLEKRSLEIMEDFGINLNPRIITGNISTAYQQIIEILRAISREVKVLIMDEPTASLSTDEVKKMFGMIRKLKKNGKTIIYISHMLEEIFNIADRVSVLRDGEFLVTKKIEDTNIKELINYMIGRDLTDKYPKKLPVEKKEDVLEVKNLFKKNVLKDISFKVKKGEILGISGLMGSGRTELVRCIFGADNFDSGKLILKNRETKIKSPRDALKKGIAMIPEDRKLQGVLTNMSVAQNITISILNKISKIFFVLTGKEKNISNKFISNLKIKTSSINQKVKTLSGGNQQKVVIAKMLATNSEVIFFDEPTKGIDVNTKYEIYELMNSLIRDEKAIVIVSSEMPELIGMADRIIVMHNGKIFGELKRDEFSQEKILHMASGIEKE